MTQPNSLILDFAADDPAAAAEFYAQVTAQALGAEILWRNHYKQEFNGYNYSFRDPWGNDIVPWKDAGENPAIPEDFTQEAVT